MANGHRQDVLDLVRHGFYQEELARLLRSLTTETIERGEARLKSAMTDAQAASAAIAFRRRHGLVIIECDPLYYVVGLHRARIRHSAMTLAEINYSEHWLIRRGYGCGVDTEFNPNPKAQP